MFYKVARRRSTLEATTHNNRHDYIPTLGGRKPLEVHRILPRIDAVTIAQLRAGDSVLLGTYCQRIRREPTATCPSCWRAYGDLSHLLNHFSPWDPFLRASRDRAAAALPAPIPHYQQSRSSS